MQTVTDLDEITRVVADLHSRGQLRTLVAAGGDGTAAELVNRTPPGVPLAILPLGTENLLAKYLRLTAAPQQLCSAIVAGQTVELDAGRANGRLFLLMASCGFDAEVVRRVHAQRVGHLNRWTYAKPILQSIRSYEYPPIRIYWARFPR